MKLELNKEYYIGRSDSWIWEGVERWWDYYVIIKGLNGGGGYWVEILSGWNKGKKDHFREIRTLSCLESLELEKKIEAEEINTTQESS